MTFAPDSKRVLAKEQSRRLILNAARTLFQMHGFEAVTVRDIVRAAGYSTGALFAHWGSKEELFIEAMGRPHLTDARGAELLARLKEAAPAQAIELLARWAA